MIDKETGFFREQYTYFKKGKNEINFLMNVYQTLILIVSMSFIGKLPLLIIISFTILFAIIFIIIANRIGHYTARKVDPTGIYLSPFFVDQTHYRLELIKGLKYLSREDNKMAILHFMKAEKILRRWLREDGQRI